jgi:hypothetical protein
MQNLDTEHLAIFVSQEPPGSVSGTATEYRVSVCESVCICNWVHGWIAYLSVGPQWTKRIALFRHNLIVRVTATCSFSRPLVYSCRPAYSGFPPFQPIAILGTRDMSQLFNMACAL